MREKETCIQIKKLFLNANAVSEVVVRSVCEECDPNKKGCPLIKYVEKIRASQKVEDGLKK